MRLFIRHISGSRASEVDDVDVGVHRELILGRAASAAVRFDPTEDRSVGRFHARIIPTGRDEMPLILSDLMSVNGTYLNGVRLTAAVPLKAGDVVRLGLDGPELEIQIDEVSSSAT